MIKYEKGTPGYLREKLKIEILRTVVYFAIVIAVFLLGYSQTHSKKNLLTVVAVVGCLPACRRWWGSSRGSLIRRWIRLCLTRSGQKRRI